MTQDESHVSVGGLLGTVQLGLNFYEDSAFWGAECETKDATVREVDRVVKQWSTKKDRAVDIVRAIWASKLVKVPPFLLN